MRIRLLPSVVALFAFLLLTSGCEGRPAPETSAPNSSASGEKKPPAPPIFEDFEGEPRLSLFPRLGDYRPENDDEVALPFYRSYLQHVERTSGAVPLPAPVGRGRVFSFRGVADIPSLSFFSPLAVEPGTTYRVSALVSTNLPKGGSAGIGILEFDEFLWIGEQYPKSLAEKHQTGAREGIRLSGRADWKSVSFTVTTGPKTRMVHLVFFREGTPDRTPVMVDDIRVEKN